MLILPGIIIAAHDMIMGQPVDVLLRDECLKNAGRVIWPKVK